MAISTPLAERKRAVIDIGSNTVRLVVYGGSPRAPETLHNEKVSARLGKGVGESGRIGRRAANAALAALARYKQLIDLLDAAEVHVVATAAARDAANGPQFLDEVRALGLSPRLLSGEEEALTSANGVAWAFPQASGIVADLGGGSLELTELAGMACTHGVSLPIGSLRLPALRAKGQADFARKITAMLKRSEWTAEPGSTLFLVGGSLRALARHAIARNGSLIDDPHGFVLSAEEALKLARSVLRKPPTDPTQIAGIAGGRVASLPDTAALLTVLIDQLRPAQMVFSSWGLREGILFADAPEGLRTISPLTASVCDFTATRGVERTLVDRVALWAGEVCQPCNSVPGDDTLQAAATALCLASARVEPNLRQSLAREWGLRKRWIGITAQDRFALAAAMLANANARDAGILTATLDPAVLNGLLHKGRTWGLAARLCRRFTGLAPAAIAGSSVRCADGTVTLQVRSDLAGLVNDSARKDLKVLADHLGLAPMVEVTDH